VREAVAAALLSAVATAKAQGMEWWTARRLNDWERARRGVRWSTASTEGGVSLTTEKPLHDATLLLLNPSSTRPSINGQECSVETVTRWGFKFQSVVLDLEANKPNVLRYEHASPLKLH
jgi:hypothetical protein